MLYFWSAEDGNGQNFVSLSQLSALLSLGLNAPVDSSPTWSDTQFHSPELTNRKDSWTLTKKTPTVPERWGFVHCTSKRLSDFVPSFHISLSDGIHVHITGVTICASSPSLHTQLQMQTRTPPNTLWPCIIGKDEEWGQAALQGILSQIISLRRS